MTDIYELLDCLIQHRRVKANTESLSFEGFITTITRRNEVLYLGVTNPAIATEILGPAVGWVITAC